MIETPLEFVGDAICLSGLTGTKLKCDVIGEYYPFWWGITSGGPSRRHRYPTAIVELNAATGEDYIKDTQETVLGSSGHALELKGTEAPKTSNLKVILIEENRDCYTHLKNVIRRRWPVISIDEAEGPIDSNSSNVYLLNKTLDEALEVLEDINLGNALYFFDPLRSVEYATLEKVANRRIRSFYITGTEFFIFVFTSDWFLGRDEFAPLPCTVEEKAWSEEEEVTVLEADALFGNQEWRTHILNDNSVEDRAKTLVELYKNRLHRWFRYILPLPFNPKANELFHLILCSNFEVGVTATRNFYASKTSNPKYQPDNTSAYQRFSRLHPETFDMLKGRRRPLEWRVLWKIIKEHEEGICDIACRDLRKLVSKGLQRILEWLREKGYLNPVDIDNAWDAPATQYKLNWEVVKEKLDVYPPLPLQPISPEDIQNEQ